MVIHLEKVVHHGRSMSKGSKGAGYRLGGYGSTPSEATLALLALGANLGWSKLRNSFGTSGKRGSATSVKMLEKAARSLTKTKTKKKKRKIKCKHADTVVRHGSIPRRISRLEELTDNLMGTLVYKRRMKDQCESTINEMNVCHTDVISKTLVELALAQLRYYDPSTPGTLVNAAFGTGTQQKEVRFRDVKSFIKIRSNGHTPATVHLYLCVPKADTSITPIGAYTNGLADVGNPSNIHPTLYFNDSPQFRDLWEVKKVKKFTINGNEIRWSYTHGCFIYDASYVDSHPFEYYTGQGAVWAYRIEGPVSHGKTTALQVGAAKAMIDVIVDNVYTVDYNAGADLTYVVVSDDTATHANLTDAVTTMRQTENLEFNKSAST